MTAMAVANPVFIRYATSENDANIIVNDGNVSAMMTHYWINSVIMCNINNIEGMK